MTPEERNTVIEALELWGTDDVSQEDYKNAKHALAIMYRERGQHEELDRLMSDHDVGGS